MKALDKLKEEVGEIDARLAELSAQYDELKPQMSAIDKERSQLAQSRQGKAQRIKELGEAPRISDHALLRFCERNYGFSLEAVRETLMSETVRAAIEMGAEGVKVPGGTLKIRGRTVTTFISNDMQDRNKRKKPRHEVELCEIAGEGKDG